MVAKKTVPDISALTEGRKQENASLPFPLTEVRLGVSKTPVPEDEYYLLRDYQSRKATFQMDAGIMDWIDSIATEMRDTYRGTEVDPPARTDIHHAAFFAFKELWEGDEKAKAFFMDWMVKRRKKVKEIQYSDR